jgi:hypothetical protein
MAKENKLRRGIRIFDNPVMDWLSRIHPAIPALFWGPIAIFMIGLGALELRAGLGRSSGAVLGTRCGWCRPGSSAGR